MDLRSIQRGQGGALSTFARAGLRLASWGYGAAETLWSAAHGCGLVPQRRLPVPVISVGNLVAGGTGKTPFVALLVERLRGLGHRPGVLARGYGPRTPSGLSDEGAVLRHLLGDDLPQEEAPDRHRAGLRLLAGSPGVDVVVLDDGFQHRRLRRNLDVVLLDAEDPWGGGRLLPRGMLRERPGALARAGLVAFTRAERTSPAALLALRQQVAGFSAADVVVVATDPFRLEVGGRVEPLGALAGTAVFAASGLGDPSAFEDTLTRLGARLVGRLRLGDHEGLPAAGWDEVEHQARAAGARWLVVTRKDAVKRPPPSAPAGATPAVPTAVLDVRHRVLEGEQLLTARLSQALARS